MSKELFELLKKEIQQQADECGYSYAEAAGDFMATVFNTLDCQFDNHSPSQSKFYSYAGRQLRNVLSDISS